MNAPLAAARADALLPLRADRLRTIIDFDKVLVLDHGCVLEYDTPAALIARDDSAFAALCRKSGEFELLKELADKAQRKVSGSEGAK